MFLLMLLVAVIPRAYSSLFPPPLIAVNITFPDTLAATIAQAAFVPTTTEVAVPQRFIFDPNTADSVTLLQLGFHQYTVRNVLSYRRHGGRFKAGADLFRVYGADSTLVQQLLPYVQIAEANTGQTAHQTFTPYAPKKPVVVELNTADSVALVGLYGIGPAMASRLMAYRSRLGGFVSLSQLTEVYGVTPELLEQLNGRITLNSQYITPINLNTVDEQTLKQHPYLRWKLATAIVNYRKQHGAFTKPDDLKRILILPDSTYQKLRPYLVVE